jgi:hypothetical protein
LVIYELLIRLDVNAPVNDCYNALQFATTQASLDVASIVTAVNPARDMLIDLTAVLSALIAGLPLLGTPAAIAGSTIGCTIATAISGSPGLAKSL